MNQPARSGSAPLATEAAPRRFLDVFIAYLKAEGVRTVYGIPGGLLHAFFEEVEHDPEMQLVVAKHEEGAAFMADGQARSTGRLAVCAGTSGPGATNLLTGVACAYADGVPLLVLTGQAARGHMGRGAAQETTREDMDIVAMFKPVTKYSAMVTGPESLSLHLRRALRLALTGRPGPVHLNVPNDLWAQPLEEDWFDPTTYRPTTRTFDRDAVAAAAEALLDAEYPVVLAGSGVASAKAHAHLENLAELVPARVCTSPRGKGVFPEDHPLSLGVMGFAGHRAAAQTVLGEAVDVLLVVGASLNETTTLLWNPKLRPRETLIQVDIDPDRIARSYPVEIPLVGDAQTVLVELIYHLHRSIREGRAPRSRWPEAPPPPAGEARYDEAELRDSTDRPLTPQRWRRELSSVLPSDAIVFSDIGGHMLFNLHHLCIRRGQDFFLNLGMGSMGHGTAAPIGAAIGSPHRPVFAIVGDACFTMNGMELLTAYEYGVPVIWIVENNQMHGISFHASAHVGQRRRLESVRYKRPIEVAAIARAMGLRTFVVDAPGGIAPAVEEALALGEPALIEVRVDPTIPPPLGARARTLAGFDPK